MKKTLAVAAALLSLSLGLPAAAQTMERHSTTVTTPDGRTVDRTVVRSGDGDRTVRRTVVREGDRTVRRTVVRHSEMRHGNGWGWGRDHHRRCVTRWHHHRRVTRCWSR